MEDKVVMIPTYIEPYDGDELRIGWASWDVKYRSIKYAYKDTSGKISRGCPELPFGVLVDMVLVAKRQGELSKDEIKKIQTAFT